MRRRYDWAQLVTDFEKSGLTQAEFAKRRGINVGTFRQGYYAARKRTAKGGPVRFVPVRVGPAEARRPGLVFEARLNELSMRFEVGTDVHYVASLLRRLSAEC